MDLRHFSFVLAAALGGCAGADSQATAAGNRQETGVARVTEVMYSPEGWPRALAADVYRPEGIGPWPGVLLVHGGSWSGADNRWQMKLLARKLARRGYVVLNATYRGAPEFRYPAPVDDLRAALRWWRARANEHGLRADRIAAYGFSAGGHLAAMVGMQDAPREERVQAVVAASAPTDLTLYPGGEILPRFLGASYGERPELFRVASPVTHVTRDDPPVFQYHGTDDRTVSPEHSRAFKAALDRAGVRNELRWVEGRGHATVLLWGGEAVEEAIQFMDTTLR